MRDQPTALETLTSGRVRGLGVCDVLRVELLPGQLPWVADELRHRVTGARELGAPDEAYELELLRRMSARLTEGPAAVATELVGPAGLVQAVARGAMHRAVGALASLSAASGRPDATALVELHRVAAAAAACVETFAEIEAVTTFNFDPGADPQAAW